MGKFFSDPDCIKQRDYVNIPVWHKAGCTGRELTVFCDDVLKNSHAELVKDIVQVILPDAVVLSGAIGYVIKNGEIKDCAVRCTETGEILPFDDFIRKYNVGLINNSTDGGDGEKVLPQALYMREKIKQHNLILCGAAGNGYGRPTEQKYNGACIMVTSVKMENGKPVYGLRAEGSNIDFAMFYGFTSGTSFSSPFLLGMAGLLRCKYPGITQGEVYDYFKKHCEDILAPGKDDKSGWGVPVMGNP